MPQNFMEKKFDNNSLTIASIGAGLVAVAYFLTRKKKEEVSVKIINITVEAT